VLVDEHRTRSAAADILKGCGLDTPRNLTVVGDDAQSIYGFAPRP
jgi:superfamily I DNA/RNA helicase